MKIRKFVALLAAAGLTAAFFGCSAQQGVDLETFFSDQPTEQIAFEGVDSEHYIQGFTIISDSGIATFEFSPDGNERGDSFRKYEKDTVTFEKKLSSEEIYSSFIFDSENHCYYAHDPIGVKIKRLDENFEYLSDLAELEAFEIKGMDLVGDFLYVLSVRENPYQMDITGGKWEGSFRDLAGISVAEGRLRRGQKPRYHILRGRQSLQQKS